MRVSGDAKILNVIAALGTCSPSFDAMASHYTETYPDHEFDGSAIGCAAITALEIDMALWRRNRAKVPPTIESLTFSEHAHMGMRERIHTQTYNRTLAQLWMEHRATIGEMSNADAVECASRALAITNARVPK